jgi:hypothetical protein
MPKRDVLKTRLTILWPTLLVIAGILTLATVLVGDPVRGYGFPFAWKTGGCPPPGIELSASCLLAIGYDWISFGLDLLLYTFVGYVVVLASSKYRARKKNALRSNDH